MHTPGVPDPAAITDEVRASVGSLAFFGQVLG
jgi:hypothetical protein